MKSELAEELLAQLMQWDRTAFQDKVRALEALAIYKYDEYGNFRPGVKFFESLAAWLGQMADPTERDTALDFVLNNLVFVSDAEMTHLIELVYPNHIEPSLRAVIAERLEIPSHRIAEIVNSQDFVSLRRRSLILGGSDGARLDRLRRSAPVLSHEQFLQSTEPASDIVKPMQEKLVEALQKKQVDLETATFDHVFIVDDFAGSGETMLRTKDGVPLGKLVKLQRALDRLADDGLVSSGVDVTVIIYVASERARNHLARLMPTVVQPNWRLSVVQELPDSARVDTSNAAFTELTEAYYDEVFTDEHKGRAPLGYGDCALPLVLSHNTPNNSASLLWADTSGEEESLLKRRALFPRYERHHRDRP